MDKSIKNISWSPLWAGALAGVGLNFLFNLCALALGLSSFSVTLEGKTSFSIIGYLIFCFFAFTCMLITGWVAGRLTPRRFLSDYWGVLWGFLSWSLLLIITVILITNMVQFTSFHSNFTSNLVEIRLKNNSPMLTGTVVDFTRNAPLSVYSETSKKIIVINAFLTFILFLTGALASCLGGFIGYRQVKKHHE